LQVWQEWAKSRYSDEDIKGHINKAVDAFDTDSTTCHATIAQAMIAYNEMILNRIINAKKTWGLAS
jgi:hypothetical protein